MPVDVAHIRKHKKLVEMFDDAAFCDITDHFNWWEVDNPERAGPLQWFMKALEDNLPFGPSFCWAAKKRTNSKNLVSSFLTHISTPDLPPYSAPRFFNHKACRRFIWTCVHYKASPVADTSVFYPATSLAPHNAIPASAVRAISPIASD